MASETQASETQASETQAGETQASETQVGSVHEVRGIPQHVELARALEAIFMVADEPQSVVGLASAVGRPVAEVRAAIAELVADFDGVAGSVSADGSVTGTAAATAAATTAVTTAVTTTPTTTTAATATATTTQRGFELREVGGGWRIYVRSEFDDVVREFVHTQNPSKLSQAALETLAVIAYKQPISRGAIASIRAVNVDSVVRTLLGRGLITEAFTDSETGAIHYETTDLLFVQLGINSLDELPMISPLLDDGSEGFDDVR